MAATKYQYLILIVPLLLIILWVTPKTVMSTASETPLNKVQENQKSIPPPPPRDAERVSIDRVGYNGDYWLIGGSYSVNDTLYPFLVKFDGVEYISLTPLANFPQNRIIDKIVWNGEYWLISYSFHRFGGIKKYDGEYFYDVSIPRGCDPTLTSLDWSGEYWLLGSGYMGSGCLLRYDGEHVEDLTPETNLTEFYRIYWEGEHWLINGRKVSIDRSVTPPVIRSGPIKVLRYDGSIFEEVEPTIEIPKKESIKTPQIDKAKLYKVIFQGHEGFQTRLLLLIGILVLAVIFFVLLIKRKRSG